jgi:hypothetical protein
VRVVAPTTPNLSLTPPRLISTLRVFIHVVRPRVRAVWLARLRHSRRLLSIWPGCTIELLALCGMVAPVLQASLTVYALPDQQPSFAAFDVLPPPPLANTAHTVGPLDCGRVRVVLMQQQ